MAGDEQANVASPPETTMHHISPKIPAFWPEDPELFFVRVDAEFAKSHPKITTEQTKFSYLVGALDKHQATLVRSQLLNPDPSTPFTSLKTELIRQFTLADHARLQRAQEETLQDKKPSALLCRLQQLLPSAKFNDTYIRDLFLLKMPVNLQTVLAAMTDKNLQSLAETADAIIDFEPQTSITSPQTGSEINALREEVHALRSELQRNNRPRTPGRANSSTSNQFCWYHSRFGRQAKKCVNPCSWGNY